MGLASVHSFAGGGWRPAESVVCSSNNRELTGDQPLNYYDHRITSESQRTYTMKINAVLTSVVGAGLVAGVIYFVIAFATRTSVVGSIIGGIVVAAIAMAIGFIFRAVYRGRALESNQ
jgi:hypothetical protein